jgi:PRC-barrel domain
MRNIACRPPLSELCYLEATKVTSPGGVLSELDLLMPDGKRLGTIKGVVIETDARRVRYFDVQSSGWLDRKRYLLEADQLAHFESVGNALRLRVAPTADVMREFDPRDLRRTSVDDIVAVISAPPQAA